MIFKAIDLKKSYRMGQQVVHALRGVSLSMNEGQYIVLLGASGSGKSTLLNILGGLDKPTSGQVFFRDFNISDASDSELTLFRRNYVGFVFQFFNLIPNLTAYENVKLATELVRDSMSPDEALRLVGLSDRKNHFPSQLSGGEQQRVAIARAIAKKPDVLLCDEPTGALDLKTGKMVLDAIERVNKELGTLVVVITHNSAISGLADRVITLSDGQISSDSINHSKISINEVSW